jgi:hypothetical protein
MSSLAEAWKCIALNRVECYVSKGGRMSGGEPSRDGEAVGCDAGELATLAIRGVRFGFARALGRGSAGAGRCGVVENRDSAKSAVVPQTDRGLGYPKPRCQTADTFTRRAAQHDARWGGQRLRDTLRPQPVLQLGSICSAYFHPASLYAHAE